jgi:hypothetical protein
MEFKEKKINKYILCFGRENEEFNCAVSLGDRPPIPEHVKSYQKDIKFGVSLFKPFNVWDDKDVSEDEDEVYDENKEWNKAFLDERKEWDGKTPISFWIYHGNMDGTYEKGDAKRIPTNISNGIYDGRNEHAIGYVFEAKSILVGGSTSIWECDYRVYWDYDGNRQIVNKDYNFCFSIHVTPEYEIDKYKNIILVLNLECLQCEVA